MSAFLVDESCPRAIAKALRQAGYDVRYAAETDRRAADADLVALAEAVRARHRFRGFRFRRIADPQPAPRAGRNRAVSPALQAGVARTDAF